FSSLEEFAKFLVRTRRTLPGLHAVFAAAEPVFESTRQLVGEAMGAPLFNTYGSREFGSIAAECGLHQGLHVNAENLLVETDSPKGSPGEVLITDLHNYGMPFIRYRIGDVATFDPISRCVCGCGGSLIRSIQ